MPADTRGASRRPTWRRTAVQVLGDQVLVGEVAAEPVDDELQVFAVDCRRHVDEPSAW